MASIYEKSCDNRHSFDFGMELLDITGRLYLIRRDTSRFAAGRSLF